MKPYSHTNDENEAEVKWKHNLLSLSLNRLSVQILDIHAFSVYPCWVWLPPHNTPIASIFAKHLLSWVTGCGYSCIWSWILLSRITHMHSVIGYLDCNVFQEKVPSVWEIQVLVSYQDCCHHCSCRLTELKLTLVCLLEDNFGKTWAVFVQTCSMRV